MYRIKSGGPVRFQRTRQRRGAILVKQDERFERSSFRNGSALTLVTLTRLYNMVSPLSVMHRILSGRWERNGGHTRSGTKTNSISQTYMTH